MDRGTAPAAEREFCSGAKAAAAYIDWIREHEGVTDVAIRLAAGRNAADEPVLETVPAAATDEPSTFRLIATPGLVQGVAANDVVRVGDQGSFSVVRRGGNLGVQVFARELTDNSFASLHAEVERLGGYLDGGGGARAASVRVFTIPVSAGFPSVEHAFNSFVSRHPGAEWFFTNVYDPVDGVTPLNWWQP
jgi:uncharacterized protein DUF4265